MAIEAGDGMAAEAGEVLVAEFERLVTHTALISDLIEEIHATAQELGQMINDTLDELDTAISESVLGATEHAQAAHQTISDFAKGLQTFAHDMRSEAVNLTRSMAEEIGHAIDEHNRMMDDSEKTVISTVHTLGGFVQSLVAELRTRLGEIDALWLEAQNAAQTVGQDARGLTHDFTVHMATAMNGARTAGDAFANEIDNAVFKSVEAMLDQIERLVCELGTRLFDNSLGSLTGTVETSVQSEVSGLINEAVDSIRNLVKEKIDEIFASRNRSEPERKALQAIFETLRGMVDSVEDKVGAVKQIKDAVGF
jgi:methyl-accepting chemotaxis protein